jgi:hypothetical protein
LLLATLAQQDNKPLTVSKEHRKDIASSTVPCGGNSGKYMGCSGMTVFCSICGVGPQKDEKFGVSSVPEASKTNS